MASGCAWFMTVTTIPSQSLGKPQTGKPSGGKWKTTTVVDRASDDSSLTNMDFLDDETTQAK